MVVASELFRVVNEELRKENQKDCIIELEEQENGKTHIVLVFINGLCKEFDENWERII